MPMPAANNQKPVKVGGGKIEHRLERGRGLFRQQQRIQHENHDGRARDDENRVVDVQTEGSDFRFKVVLTDLVIGLDDIGYTIW